MSSDIPVLLDILPAPAQAVGSSDISFENKKLADTRSFSDWYRESLSASDSTSAAEESAAIGQESSDPSGNILPLLEPVPTMIDGSGMLVLEEASLAENAEASGATVTLPVVGQLDSAATPTAVQPDAQGESDGPAARDKSLPQVPLVSSVSQESLAEEELPVSPENASRFEQKDLDSQKLLRRELLQQGPYAGIERETTSLSESMRGTTPLPLLKGLSAEQTDLNFDALRGMLKNVFPVNQGLSLAKGMNEISKVAAAPLETADAINAVDSVQEDQLQADQRGISSQAISSLGRGMGTLGLSLHHANWGQALSDRVVWHIRQNIQEADLKLNPPHLGSIEIRISMNNDQANIVFNSQSAQVREALEQSLPRLREAMENAGLSLGDVNVSSDSRNFRETHEDRTGNAGVLADGDAIHNNLQHIKEGATLTAIRSNERIIDYFA